MRTTNAAERSEAKCSARRTTWFRRALMPTVAALIGASPVAAQDGGHQMQQQEKPCGPQGDPCPATLKKSLDAYLAGPASDFLTDINDNATAGGATSLAWYRPGCDTGQKPENCTPHQHRGECGGGCLKDLTTYKWKAPKSDPQKAKEVLGANPWISRIDPSNLPDYGVVLARIDYRGGKRDGHYRIGNVRRSLWWKVGYPDARRRVFYLIGERPKYDASTKPMPGLAQWRLIALEDNKLSAIRAGYWHICPSAHKDEAKYDKIAFVKCEDLPDIQRMSEDPKVRFVLRASSAADAFNRLVRGVKPQSEKQIRRRLLSAAAVRTEGVGQLTKDQASTDAKRIRKDLDLAVVSTIDGPFWFRCGIGCCTTGL